MSSKLVKKGLDFVSSTNESIQEKRKKSLKNKKKNSRKRGLDALYKGSSSNKKGKIQTKDDFTEQNLKYFKQSSWSIKKDTYEKIVQHQEKKSKKKEKTTAEDTEQEDDLY